MREAEHNEQETDFLYQGFKQGFDLGYRGPEIRADVADNIPFSVGVKFQMWEKIMTEVEMSCFAGPFKFGELPFKNYVQSPIGLVPKTGNKTRLIFHLSYQFKNGNPSINQCTPKELSSVKYNDLDKAIKDCLELIKLLGVESGVIYFSKSDLKSAFRVLPLLVRFRPFLLLKAEHPVTGQWFFFIEKCLSFGASISCSHFQRFSNGLKAIVEYKANKILKTLVTNYLDDFLFIYITSDGCNKITIIFLEVCKDINFPVAEDKTEWASTMVVFLGMLLNGRTFTLSIPMEKRREAFNMVRKFKDKNKATVKELQKLAGHLNFINRAVVPGRVFTRRMYAKFAGPKFLKMKAHHHVRIDNEFKRDCEIWEAFLVNIEDVVRPFVDFSHSLDAKLLNFFSDASAAETLGFGVIFGTSWTFGHWEINFIKQCKPNIEFLELYALCVGIFIWSDKLKKTRVIVHCDNEAVVHMINSMTSICRQCMKLLRILTLKNMRNNRRVFAQHIMGKDNILSDALSRLQFDRFFLHAPKNVDRYPHQLPEELWPLREKSWDKKVVC